MDCTIHRSVILNTSEKVRVFSYKQKVSLSENEQNDLLLDAILDIRQALIDTTNQIESINEEVLKLTWFNDLDEECLMLINDLIAAAKDCHSSMVRQYTRIIISDTSGIGDEIISNYKLAIDDLKETYEDLESAFFFLPEMPEFKEVTKALNTI